MSDTPEAAPPTSSTVEPPAAPTGSVGPRREPPGPSRRVRRVVVVGLVAAIVLSVPVLGRIGVDAALRGAGPGAASTGADPSLPGYQAFVAASPTVLVADVGPDGRLVAAALVGGSARQGGGGVLLLPAALRVEASGPTLGEAFGDDGPLALAGRVEAILRVDVGEVVRLDDASWRETVGATTTLRIDNPAPILGDAGEDLFPAGPLELPADRIAAYLHRRAPGEDELEALYRAELVWAAWLARGGASAGVLGDLVRGLLGVDATVLTLPVSAGGDAERRGYTAAVGDVDEAVALVVPFPAPPERGGRTRVRLLDGTGDPDRSLRVAGEVVPLGASILVVGNADRFDHDLDEVEYHRPSAEPAARRIAARLGVTDVSFTDQPDSAIDVTIVVGRSHRFDPEVPNATVAR